MYQSALKSAWYAVSTQLMSSESVFGVLKHRSSSCIKSRSFSGCITPTELSITVEAGNRPLGNACLGASQRGFREMSHRSRDRFDK
jgi:hypothetical protein